MKKIFLLLLVLSLLTGCQTTKKDDKTIAYQSTLQTVSEATDFIQDSTYYTLSGEVKKEDDKYIYYITLQDAKVAMMNIQMLAVEDDANTKSNMQPSIGIFDGAYNMIPNQVNTKNGYVKGLIISGEAIQYPVKVKLGVFFQSEKKENKQEFWYLILDESGLHNAES